jgi:hypothetical protein
MPAPGRIYTDIDMNFSRNPITGDIPVLSDTNSVVSALKNLLLTAHYEKPFNPEYGCGIRSYLFEHVSMMTASILQQEITQTITNYEPRVQIQNLIVQANPDNNSYEVSVVFFMLNNPDPITLNFFLERIR